MVNINIGVDAMLSPCDNLVKAPPPRRKLNKSEPCATINSFTTVLFLEHIPGPNYTLVNVYVDLVVLTRIVGTS